MKSMKGGGGRRQKDMKGHAKPGQNMGDAKPGSMPARTGYTQGGRTGPGKHGVGISVGSK